MNLTTYLLLPLYLLIGCKENNSSKQINERSFTLQPYKCNLNEAENTILKCKEVMEKNKMIDSISNHRHGISLLSDSISIRDIVYYEIKAGVNSELRFENFYTFYVEKGNCDNIKIFEPISGKIIGINEWRILKGADVMQKTDLIITNSIKNINLPFSFYEYFNEGFSDEKYPFYEPSSLLVNFFKGKGYDAEGYKCFVLLSKDQRLYLLISISRGDSEYFLLLTSKNNKIIDYKEIGAIGDENPITFKIFPNFIVERYKGNVPNAIPFEKLKVNNENKIVNFK